MTRESDILEAMALATPAEQKRLVAELQSLRSRTAAVKRTEAELDLAGAVVRDHLTPVRVHGMHSSATDWLGEVAPNYHEAQLGQVEREIRTEASNWFRHVSPAVRAEQSEFVEQARGMARRTASQYGLMAKQAGSLFMRHVAHLYRLAEGTDMAGVPSASGSDGNPDADPWKTENSTGSPADIGEYQAPPSLDTMPQPADPAKENGSGDMGELTGDTVGPTGDSAPTGAPSVGDENLLDVSDSNNAGGATQSEVSQATARRRHAVGTGHNTGLYDDEGNEQTQEEWDAENKHASLYARRAARFLATEEGQNFPVPGEVEAEQDGEAASSLPYEVRVGDAPETMDNFIDFNKDDPAAVSSERAKNIGANASKPVLVAGRNPFAGSLGKQAISTGPNLHGSMIYDPERVTDLGYAEGYRYALTWAPGKPVPAAMSSSVSIGHKYNAEYVEGYRKGLGDGISQLPQKVQSAWKRVADRALQMRPTAPRAGSRMAALPQLDLADMDDTVSNPLTFKGDGVSGVDGRGAADVGNVPTPGQKPADYPVPGDTNKEPAIGEQPADDWVSGASVDNEKTAAFRQAAQLRLRCLAGDLPPWIDQKTKAEVNKDNNDGNTSDDGEPNPNQDGNTGEDKEADATGSGEPNDSPWASSPGGK